MYSIENGVYCTEINFQKSPENDSDSNINYTKLH